MSKENWVPGPWEAWENRRGWQVSQCGKGIHGHWVAHLKCDSCPGKEEDTAYLLAAAPELYKALDAVTGEDGYTSLPEGLRREIESALAKARGEHYDQTEEAGHER